MINRAIYVSPTEPHSLRGDFTQSSITEKYGVDFLWSSPKGMVGVQRKTPIDLIASLRDGRISKQTALSESLFIRAVFIEGYPSFTISGEMIIDHVKFTRNQWKGALFGLQARGWWVVQTRDRGDLLDSIERLFHYTEKEKRSATARKGPRPDSWRRISNRSWGVHILTSIPGIGSDTAERILDAFGRVPLAWDVRSADLQDIKGIGDKKFQEMTKFVRPREIKSEVEDE